MIRFRSILELALPLKQRVWFHCERIFEQHWPKRGPGRKHTSSHQQSAQSVLDIRKKNMIPLFRKLYFLKVNWYQGLSCRI
jgi:hypothetical protein